MTLGRWLAVLLLVAVVGAGAILLWFSATNVVEGHAERPVVTRAVPDDADTNASRERESVLTAPLDDGGDSVGSGTDDDETSAAAPERSTPLPPPPVDGSIEDPNWPEPLYDLAGVGEGYEVSRVVARVAEIRGPMFRYTWELDLAHDGDAARSPNVKISLVDGAGEVLEDSASNDWRLQPGRATTISGDLWVRGRGSEVVELRVDVN